MKTKTLISVCLLFSVCAFSQIKVDANGNAIIGPGTPSSSYDLTVADDLKVNDNLVVNDDIIVYDDITVYDDLTVNSKITTSNLEVSGINSNYGYVQLDINSPGSTTMTVISPEYNTMGYVSGSDALEVAGDLTVYGTFTQSSDKRIKKDIKTVNTSSLFTKFSSFDSKSYQFLNRKEMLNMMKEEKIPYQSDTLDLTDEKVKKRVASIEKAAKKSINSIDGVEQINDSLIVTPRIKCYAQDNISYGFLAQDVEKEFPELVKIDKETGLYSVDYISFIPLLFQATKELKKENDELKEEIAAIKSYLGLDKEDEVIKSKSISSSISSSIVKEASISQNSPNPFSESTEISYFLPEGVSTASVYIYDMNGKQLKTYPLNGEGHNTLTINEGELYAGMFTYALVVDGTLVDSKRMILTD